MRLDTAELVVRLIGLWVLGVVWVVAAISAVDGAARRAGRARGLARRFRAQVVYAIAAVPYFTVSVLLWRPLPLSPSAVARVVALVAGSTVALAGAALYVLGRRELGAMYNVSSSLGSELYADHALVTSGPYAWCRHPMYTGVAASALGGLLVYRTWTLVFACLALGGELVKARAEERLLAAEFGAAWERYRASVPMFIPRRPHRTVEEVSHGQ